MGKTVVCPLFSGFGFAEGVGAAVALFVVVGGVEDDGLRFQGKLFAGAHLGAFGGQGAAGAEADVVPDQGGDFSGAAGCLAAGGEGGFTGTEEALVFAGAGAGFVECFAASACFEGEVVAGGLEPRI